MSNDQQTGKTAAKQAKQDAADRLAKALRDNLHRRKAQARARKSTDAGLAQNGPLLSNDETAIQPDRHDLTPKAKVSRRMDGLEINGGTALRGDIVISGAKNAALPLLCLGLMSSAPLVLEMSLNWQIRF